MDQLTKLGPLAALVKLWNDLTAPQRLVVIAFVSVSAVVVLFIAMAASKPRMAVLFSNLSQEDAGAIAQKLSEQKIPYTLAASGTTIEVPATQVDELRLSMATQGLPQGGSVGFELFDKQSFGMTEFGEKVGYQRAISGELKRTICSLAPVSDAKVLIQIPDESVFASEQQSATASIALKLRRGMPLSDEQIGGIVHLVASAVEGLRPENVTVVDGDGKMLSESIAGTGGGGILTTSQSKIKRQYESELAQNIQSMLAKVVGPDKAVVRVTADMSFDKRQIKSEKYEPQSTDTTTGPRGIPVEEERRVESYNGGVLPPKNMPGQGQNRPVITDGKDHYERDETTTRYEVTKTIEESVSAPGKLDRLSVAVLVDDKIDNSKLGAIREAVTAAAGINDTRGDQITVQKIAFDTETETRMAKEMAKAEKSSMIMSLAKNGGAALLLLIFLLFLKRIIKGIKVQAPLAPALTPATDMGLISQVTNPGAMLAGTDSRTYSQPEPVKQEENHIPPEPSLPVDVAQSNPEDLARLVRTWMSES